jgi:hypothetical protein
MPYSHFIPVKRLAGELILSQKRKSLGTTLTTKEFVFQRPHISYHILLADVIGMVPCILDHPWQPASKWPESSSSDLYYKISVRDMHVITRHDLHSTGPATLIFPLNERFVHYIRTHTDFMMLPGT